MNFPQMYGPPRDYKRKNEGRSTGLRKCIRPFWGGRFPDHDDLRCELFLINGTVTCGDERGSNISQEEEHEGPPAPFGIGYIRKKILRGTTGGALSMYAQAFPR
jgi:hypothetical protein